MLKQICEKIFEHNINFCNIVFDSVSRTQMMVLGVPSKFENATLKESKAGITVNNELTCFYINIGTFVSLN